MQNLCHTVSVEIIAYQSLYRYKNKHINLQRNDKDLKCRGFQYEVGKEYMQSGSIHCCDNGFHFCENPFDVFNYYEPSNSRYCEVEGDGETDRGDDKVAVSHIHIGAELGLNGLIKASVKFIFDKVKWDDAPATNTGNRSAATNTGDCSAAKVGGKDSVAIVTGKEGKAAGALGCWIVLTERDADWHIVDMKAVKVDGTTIKADTYYTLKNREIIEVED